MTCDTLGALAYLDLSSGDGVCTEGEGILIGDENCEGEEESDVEEESGSRGSWLVSARVRLSDISEGLFVMRYVPATAATTVTPCALDVQSNNSTIACVLVQSRMSDVEKR